MIEFLTSINPETVATWLGILAMALGIWKNHFANVEKNRSDAIFGAAPSLHRLVEKIAKETPTKKDDEFVKQMNIVLDALGYKPVTNEKEVALVKSLGTAEHEEYKMYLDPEEPREEPKEGN